MTEDIYWVVIRAKRKQTGRRRKTTIVERMGPFDYAEANAARERVTYGSGLDHRKFTVQVNIDRTKYFEAYHRRRYENDPAYRDRKRERAQEHHQRARAAARGDMTPWLKQD